MSWDNKIKATAVDLSWKARQLGKSIPKPKSIRSGTGSRRRKLKAT